MPERVIRIDSATGEARVEADAWRFLAPGEASRALPEGRIVVDLATWKQRRGELVARGAVGVRLDPADDAFELAGALDAISLVAVHFPRFTDGRGCSTAVLLRTRLGYKGELRAFGDVGRDQMFNLRRCGFDAFALAPHRDAASALAGLGDFTLRYQASVDDPLPLFRKRLAAQGGTHLASAG